MAEGDFMDDRRRASEEDYFRKQDRELIEKMRQAAAANRAQSEMSAKTGLNDPALIAELGALGFTPETISVLPLVPIIQMAWAEGGVTPAERYAPRHARAGSGNCGGKRRGSSARRVDGSSAIAHRVRECDSPHSSDARHGSAGGRHDERRRSHQVRREHGGGLGRLPRIPQDLAGGTRDARQDFGVAKSSIRRGPGCKGATGPGVLRVPACDGARVLALSIGSSTWHQAHQHLAP